MFIYWIPALFVAIALLDFYGVRGKVTNTGDAVGGFVWAAVIILVCECFFFGFRLTLFADRLVYRYLGFPLFLSRTILRQSIVDATLESQIRYDMKPWAFMELQTETDGKRKSHTISLVSFSRQDIKAFMEWLLPR